MEEIIFKKMRLKEKTKGAYLYAPEEFTALVNSQKYIDFCSSPPYAFVLLFVTSRQEYADRIQNALSLLSEKGVLWIAYAKAKGKLKYDINRDSLWELARKDKIEACSNIALDDTWSAIRFKKRENVK